MSSSTRVSWLLLLGALLTATMYPALLLGRQVLPERSLRSVAPWRWEVAPDPSPSPLALHAATHLGPRLAGINREGLELALWNPFIGGGRPGWLASAAEGGAPLPVLAGLLARSGWHWTALVALHLTVAFTGVFLLLVRSHLNPWAAGAGALAFTLSGASVGTWMHWGGSALALAGWIVLPSTLTDAPWRRSALAWFLSLSATLWSGTPALPFLLLALFLSLTRDTRPNRRWWLAALWGGVCAAAVRAPGLWLDLTGWEGAPFAGRPSTARISPASLRSLVDPWAAGDPTDGPLAGVLRAVQDPGSAFVGGLVLALAAAALVLNCGRRRWHWIATATVGAAVLFLPSSLWGELAARPAGLLALGAAALAAIAVDALLRRISPARQWVGGAAVALALLLHLVPPAGQRLPFAREREGRVVPTISAEARPVHGAVTALFSTLPPDAAAHLGLADVRAADLSREPRYAALLGVRPDGEHPLARALDLQAARLGVEVIFEPAPLRLVSQHIFSRVEVEEVQCNGAVPAGHRPSSCTFPVPSGVYRLGVALPAATGSVIFLRRAQELTTAPADHDLDPESDRWHWARITPECARESCTVELRGPALPGSLTVAWDRSWLELISEGTGFRAWRRTDIAMPVFVPERLVDESDQHGGPKSGTSVPNALCRAFPHDTPPPATVEIIARRPHSWLAYLDTPEPTVAVARIKYRPRLWHARVDGRSVEAFPADGLWTAILVPAGRHQVSWRVEIPVMLWGLALVGLSAMGWTALGWRRR